MKKTHFFETVATYILAPLPNALCGRCSGEDDIMSDYNRYGLYVCVCIKCNNISDTMIVASLTQDIL